MKRLALIILCLLTVAGITGCSFPWQKSEKAEPKYDGYLYFLNDDHTDLVREGFRFEGKSGQALAEMIASRLAANAEDEHDSPLPDGVVIEKVLIEDAHIHVYLNAMFNKAAVTEQTLCMAALVKSFDQISDAHGVLFYTDNQPLADNAGNVYDVMTKEGFLYSPSIYPTEAISQTLDLYYGDKNSAHLKKESVSVKTSGEEQPVRIIVQHLIDGPAFEEETALIPPNTQIISAVLVGDTAYINLDNGFADTNVKVEPSLAVYSIVNSVTANTSASLVQIQIEGKTPASYGGEIDLRHPLKTKKSLIK